MKKLYERPEVELIALTSTEVIASDEVNPDDDPLMSGGLGNNPFG